MESFIRNILTITIAFLPVAGPFFQIAFPIGWTLLLTENPQNAFELVKALCPGVDLAGLVVQELIKSSNETKQFLSDGWQTLNLSTQFGPLAYAKFHHLKSSTNPDSTKKAANDQGDGEKTPNHPVLVIV